ncbi:cytochrome-c peroxidase [Roseovarius sp. MMSF_3281]|uniref:cytochrome-c peroxidase n=1 Tax=Roseovarius sp. MMSF_3281 TaxID=3046694 RepID=UPI00273FB1F5|nr:cytochrome c peroxidase [Roseovarius sp. MMSF_3281]
MGSLSVIMRAWVAIGVLSLQASLSLAADLPEPATRADFPTPGATSVLLGRDLFFDPVLSGNRNISCASCHHPEHGSADGLSLNIGEGGIGLGPSRRANPENPPQALVPRNAPALFNLGAQEFKALFHDGRVENDPSQRFGIRLPEGQHLERPLPLLAAQALIPMVAPGKMAGQPGENPVADLVAQGQITGPSGAWQAITARVEAIPDYRRRFAWLNGPDEPLHITDIARVIAAFISYEFRATDSPFDAFLMGNNSALTNDQLRGMSLFYGKAGCANCHSGPLQTDHRFHALGVPQLGPGKGHGPKGHADHGRGRVTGKPQDRYRFRTPSLRNVALTAPYGHTGAYSELGDVIRHHLDPETALAEYLGLEKTILPDHGLTEPLDPAMQDFDEVLAISQAISIDLAPLGTSEIDAIIAFLHALTDPVSLNGRLGAPNSVPSGLPVDNGTSGPS